MRPVQILCAAGLGLPLVAAFRPDYLDACSVDGSTQLKKEAIKFCRDFLALKTVTTTLTTVTPVVSSTITKTSTTSTTTTTETTTTTFTTTRTTTTSTSITTSTTTVNPAPPPKEKRAIAERPCPSLDSKILRRYPAASLSRACSCLGVTPTTSTMTVPTATAPTTTVLVTSTTIQTLLFTSTKVSTTTSVETIVSATSTTTTAVATYTLPAQCVNPPLSGVFAADTGNQFQPTVAVSSVQECCALCYKTFNCVGAGFGIEGTCNLLVKVQFQSGTGTSDQCPLGFDNTSNLSPPSPRAVEGVFPEPCRL